VISNTARLSPLPHLQIRSLLEPRSDPHNAVLYLALPKEAAVRDDGPLDGALFDGGGGEEAGGGVDGLLGVVELELGGLHSVRGSKG
jgi:hypothetical protein